MKDSSVDDSAVSSVVQDTKPGSCPACSSSSIVTTAKIPDADSYWRCTKCGEVWNDGRRQKSQYTRNGWR